MAGRADQRARSVSERTRYRHRQLADSVRKIIEQRFTEPLTVTAIAAELGVSPCFLCRVFRHETGATIHGTLTSQRLTRAYELLSGRQGENLAMLGLDLGFASHGHFTQAFCRRFGRPPSVVRAQLLTHAHKSIFEQDS